ncbi:hypothetical protein M3484_09030 [Pseudomonas sp. GX19020]|nr:hypothetical protein [Pseudomonas sp. GX19020]MCL4066714.1 hypothetical protein [Pseudomonas sp. GX19020]
MSAIPGPSHTLLAFCLLLSMASCFLSGGIALMVVPADLRMPIPRSDFRI